MINQETFLKLNLRIMLRCVLYLFYQWIKISMINYYQNFKNKYQIFFIIFFKVWFENRPAWCCSPFVAAPAVIAVLRCVTSTQWLTWRCRDTNTQHSSPRPSGHRPIWRLITQTTRYRCCYCRSWVKSLYNHPNQYLLS